VLIEHLGHGLWRRNRGDSERGVVHSTSQDEVSSAVDDRLVPSIDPARRIFLNIPPLHNQPQGLACRKMRSRQPDFDVDRDRISWAHLALPLVAEDQLLGRAHRVDFAMRDSQSVEPEWTIIVSCVVRERDESTVAIELE
jgi:hypothetical protein